jgi:DNA uptake protein ComE-like DNA-binding protein
VVNARPFEVIEAIDAVSYMGAAGLRKILAYVQRRIAEAQAAGTMVEAPAGAGTPPAVATPAAAPSAAPVTVSGVSFTGAEAQAALAAVNSLSQADLDAISGFSSRVAGNIVAARPIASLQALDAVSYVGKTVLRGLLAYAKASAPAAPAVGPGADIPTPAAAAGLGPDAAPVTTSGVRFSAAEATAALALVNSASQTVLDDDVGFGARLAGNVVDARPLDSLGALDRVSYMGKSALGRLLAYVQRQGAADVSPDTPGGAAVPAPAAAQGVTVEGVRFTGAEAAAALDLANTGALATLDDDVRLTAGTARGVVAGRPHGDLVAVGKVRGMGKSALTRLRDYVRGQG